MMPLWLFLTSLFILLGLSSLSLFMFIRTNGIIKKRRLKSQETNEKIKWFKDIAHIIWFLVLAISLLSIMTVVTIYIK